MWENFKAVIDRQMLDSTSENHVIEAANDTFKKFKEWLDESYR
jgi:heme oxygenase